MAQTKKERNKRLCKVLRKLQDMNVTLSPEKCKFARNQVPFLGHIIDSDDGIHADPQKVTAITDMAVHQSPSIPWNGQPIVTCSAQNVKDKQLENTITHVVNFTPSLFHPHMWFDTKSF